MPVVPFKGPHPLGEGIQVHFGSVGLPPSMSKPASVDGRATPSEPPTLKPSSKSDPRPED